MSDPFCMSTDYSTKAIRRSLESNVSQQVFLNKLEKRLDDIKEGDYRLATDVDSELSRRDASVSLELSSTNPQASKLYAGYSSMMRYDRAARFVSNVEFNVRAQVEQKSKEDIEQEIQSIVEAYTRPEKATASTDSEGTTEPPVSSYKTIQDIILEGGHETSAEQTPTTSAST